MRPSSPLGRMRPTAYRRRGVGPWVALAVVFAGGCGDRSGPGAPRVDTPLELQDRVVPVAELEQGREIYNKLCRSCHGAAGDGQGPAASSLRYPPRDFRAAQFPLSLARSPAEADLPSHEALVATIREGAPTRGMPSWAGLPAEDLDAVANYLKTFSTRWLRTEDGDLHDAHTP